MTPDDEAVFGFAACCIGNLVAPAVAASVVGEGEMPDSDPVLVSPSTATADVEMVKVVIVPAALLMLKEMVGVGVEIITDAVSVAVPFTFGNALLVKAVPVPSVVVSFRRRDEGVSTVLFPFPSGSKSGLLVPESEPSLVLESDPESPALDFSSDPDLDPDSDPDSDPDPDPDSELDSELESELDPDSDSDPASDSGLDSASDVDSSATGLRADLVLLSN